MSNEDRIATCLGTVVAIVLWLVKADAPPARIASLVAIFVCIVVVTKEWGWIYIKASSVGGVTPQQPREYDRFKASLVFSFMAISTIVFGFYTWPGQLDQPTRKSEAPSSTKADGTIAAPVPQKDPGVSDKQTVPQPEPSQGSPQKHFRAPKTPPVTNTNVGAVYEKLQKTIVEIEKEKVWSEEAQWQWNDYRRRSANDPTFQRKFEAAMIRIDEHEKQRWYHLLPQVQAARSAAIECVKQPGPKQWTKKDIDDDQERLDKVSAEFETEMKDAKELNLFRFQRATIYLETLRDAVGDRE